VWNIDLTFRRYPLISHTGNHFMRHSKNKACRNLQCLFVYLIRIYLSGGGASYWAMRWARQRAFIVSVLFVLIFVWVVLKLFDMSIKCLIPLINADPYFPMKVYCPRIRRFAMKVYCLRNSSVSNESMLSTKFGIRYCILIGSRASYILVSIYIA
jgi:hypothetical protein